MSRDSIHIEESGAWPTSNNSFDNTALVGKIPAPMIGKISFYGWLRMRRRTVVPGLPEFPLPNTEWEFQLGPGHCIVKVSLNVNKGETQGDVPVFSFPK